jgi:hypothetical protein
MFPWSFENFPGAQALHPDSSATPSADEYRPAEQFWHVE